MKNFIIYFLSGLFIGLIVLVLAFPAIEFHTSPLVFYPNHINQYLRTKQDLKDLSQYINKDPNRVPVLTYRELYDSKDNDYVPSDTAISTATFEEQVKTLSSLGYHFLTPDELWSAIQKKSSLPEKAILITFDECNEEIYTLAFPILQKYQAKATINLAGYMVEYSYNYEANLLNWKEIKAMADSQLISFGSATYQSNMPVLNFNGDEIYPFVQLKDGETAETYQQRINEDLKKNNTLIKQRTGQTPICLAYPFNMSNNATAEAVKQAGLQLGFTSGNNQAIYVDKLDSPLHLPRYDINEEQSIREFLRFINKDN